jgi:hypothetical protein
MKLLLEQWREYLNEYSYPDEEQKPITWVAPDFDGEYAELFAKGVQLLSEGEFQGILQSDIELGNIPSGPQEVYNDLNKHQVFRDFAQGQTDSANCVAGESFYETVKSGKLVATSIEELSPSLVKQKDLPFATLNKLNSSDLSREEKVKKAVELVSKENVPGETRETEKLAMILWKASNTMQAPMIYKKRDGELFLLGGRTRLAACFALGINPQIWLATEKPLASIVKQNLQKWKQDETTT